MEITDIRSKKMFGGPGNCVYLAEATVEKDDETTVYVTIQYYDGEMYTASAESVFDTLANDDGDIDVVEEFEEEYDDWNECKKSSAYAKVFAKLRKVIDAME